jgi:SAM-dependent methyltransferase
MVDMRSAWNANSEAYQSLHEIGTESAHYGPWAPLENDLRLLGNVRGLRIFEAGCGGGQCTIAFAKQGAIATGVDLSDTQIEFARKLVAQERVDVTFAQADITDLATFEDESQDIVFSTYVFQYVADIDRCLRECSRLLKPNGRLVFSLDHPFRDCFHDDEEDTIAIYPVRSYFDDNPMHWTFGQNSTPMQSYHRSIAQWYEMLTIAGFQPTRLLEPEPPVAMLDEIWPLDDPLASMRMVPQTIIFVTEKT